MIDVLLPNGQSKKYNNPISPFEIAKEISSSLAKEALIAKVDDDLWDLNRLIHSNCKIKILTNKDPETLSVLRHDAAHIMAEAVLELYPDTQITIGPAIENGFYYDFYRLESFILDDLNKIEKRMHEIVKRNEKIHRKVWKKQKAIEFFKKNGENFKVELVEEIPEEEEVTFYSQGKFIDLCRGPHFTSTSKLGHAFKLMKLAGSYWRGDSNNQTLQRYMEQHFLNKKI